MGVWDVITEALEAAMPWSEVEAEAPAETQVGLPRSIRVGVMGCLVPFYWEGDQLGQHFPAQTGPEALYRVRSSGG